MLNVHALKYMRDPLSREPRNVGLIVSRAHGEIIEVAARFVGEREDGSVQGRALKVPTDVYQRWVAYYLRKVRAGQWDDLARLARSRPTSFYLDNLSTIYENDSPELVLEQLYPQVVSLGPAASGDARGDDFKERVETLLLTAGVMPERERTVEGKVEDEVVPVEFAYSYTNGQLHLMDRVQTHGHALSVRKNAYDFAMRARMARDADASNSFLAFVDALDDVEPNIEADLRVLYKVAHVIDVAVFDHALEQVTEIMGH